MMAGFFFHDCLCLLEKPVTMTTIGRLKLAISCRRYVVVFKLFMSFPFSSAKCGQAVWLLQFVLVKKFGFVCYS
jgi:hypothetical protein